MRYSSFWKDLQVVSGLEKLASTEDVNVAAQSQVLLAQTCDGLFESVKRASREVTHSLLHEGPPSFPDQVLRVMHDMRGDHQVTGEKFAASEDETTEMLHKLSAAALVDDVLSQQLEKLAGEEYEAARKVQLLGREYAVRLMRGLFA